MFKAGGSSALEEVRSPTLAPPSRHHYRIATYPKTKPFTPPPAIKSYVLPSSALTNSGRSPSSSGRSPSTTFTSASEMTAAYNQTYFTDAYVRSCASRKDIHSLLTYSLRIDEQLGSQPCSLEYLRVRYAVTGRAYFIYGLGFVHHEATIISLERH